MSYSEAFTGRVAVAPRTGELCWRGHQGDGQEKGVGRGAA